MNEIITNIIEQLGGNKFLAMTGCNHIVYSNNENSVRMHIPKNTGKVNRMEIVYINGLDLYNIKFYKFTAGRYNSKTGTFSHDKITNNIEFSSVYAEQLSKIFEQITGMYTRL